MIPYPFSQRWRHPQRTNERVGGILYIQVNHAHLAESSDFSIMPFVFSPFFSLFNDRHAKKPFPFSAQLLRIICRWLWNCIAVKLILSAVECLEVLSCFINANQMYGSCEEVRDSRCVFFIHQITVKQLVPGFFWKVSSETGVGLHFVRRENNKCISSSQEVSSLAVLRRALIDSFCKKSKPELSDLLGNLALYGLMRNFGSILWRGIT